MSAMLLMFPMGRPEMVTCLVLLGIACVAVLAARKVRRDDDAALKRSRCENEAEEPEDEDVFWSLRKAPPRVPTAEELVNIVGACLSELRSAQLRVRVAQGTLDVTAYDDSLMMAQREMDAVHRCLSVLKARHEGVKEVQP